MTARSLCFDYSHDSIPMKHVTSPPPQGELCPQMRTADMGQWCCMLGRSCHCTVLGAAIRQQESGRSRTLSALVCFAVPGFTASVLALVSQMRHCRPFLGRKAKSAAEAEAPGTLSKQVRERQRALISMSTVAVFKFLFCIEQPLSELNDMKF